VLDRLKAFASRELHVLDGHIVLPIDERFQAGGCVACGHRTQVTARFSARGLH